MNQRTIYNNDHLRLAEEPCGKAGDVLWIADELDGQKVSLSREQLAEIMPLLKAWLVAGEGGDFSLYARRCSACKKYYELIGRDDRSEYCRACYPSAPGRQRPRRGRSQK